MIFPSKTVQQLHNVLGANASFLKQICVHLECSYLLQQKNGESSVVTEESINWEALSTDNPDAYHLLSLVHEVLASTPTHVTSRWLHLVHNLDNRPFFQGIAEIASYAHMKKQGWIATEWNECCLVLEHQTSKQRIRLLSLAFILQRDHEQEKQIEEVLCQRINAIQTPHAIDLTLRNPLSSKTNIDAIVQAIETWIQQIDPKKKRTQRGYCKDAVTWIECRWAPNPTTKNVVQIVQQPLMGQSIQKIIDRTADASLEKIRQNNMDTLPLVLSIVGNQTFQISDNSWRFFLYGPNNTMVDKRYQLNAHSMRGWLQDPFRTFVSAVLCIERFQVPSFYSASSSPHPHQTIPSFHIRSFSNPWSEFSSISSGSTNTVVQDFLPTPSLQISEQDAKTPILAWKR